MASRWRSSQSDAEEEGEVAESGADTSDDDYSPGSLVIDAKDGGMYVCMYMYMYLTMYICIYNVSSAFWGVGGY